MLRRYFIAGLLIWLPIWVTYFVIKFIVELMDRTMALIPDKFQPAHLVGFDIPGLGLLLTVGILLVTGLLVTNFVGKRLIQLWDKIISRVPIIRSIYTAVQQVSKALLQPSGQSFRKAMLVQYPRKGVWSIGFLTSEKIALLAGDQHKVAIFIPTTPNPTSGFLTFVDPEDTQELNITVEEALRLVISVGVVTPDSMQPKSDLI